jgi:hypothetical protein
MLEAGCRAIPAAAMPAVFGEPHSLDHGLVEEIDQLSKPSQRSAVNYMTAVKDLPTKRNGFLGFFFSDF